MALTLNAPKWFRSLGCLTSNIFLLPTCEIPPLGQRPYMSPWGDVWDVSVSPPLNAVSSQNKVQCSQEQATPSRGRNPSLGLISLSSVSNGRCKTLLFRFILWLTWDVMNGDVIWRRAALYTHQLLLYCSGQLNRGQQLEIDALIPCKWDLNLTIDPG